MIWQIADWNGANKGKIREQLPCIYTREVNFRTYLEDLSSYAIYLETKLNILLNVLVAISVMGKLISFVPVTTEPSMCESARTCSVLILKS